MKKRWMAASLLLGLFVSHSVLAESNYSVSMEYEAEKEKASGDWSDSLYIIPSFVVHHNPVIDRVELLLGYSQARRSDGGSVTDLGVRLHKNVEFNDSVEGFVRAAVGHRYMNVAGASDYNWGYIEPGLEVKLTHMFGLAISERMENSIDGTQGSRVNSMRVGPNIEFNDNNELELRYISTTGDYDAESYMAEYTLKF